MSRQPDERAYVIAYDVVDDRRRDMVAKTLGSYGNRVQYSVFIVICTQAALLRLRRKLTQIIAREEDSILVATLGHEGTSGLPVSWIGQSRVIEDDTPIVV